MTSVLKRINATLARWALTAAILAALLMLTIPGAGKTVRAEGEAKSTSVEVAPIEQLKGKPAVITATLRDPDGKVLGSQLLRFYVETDAFGPRLMKVGEALTDVSGTAAVSFKPTWLGENKVTVIYPGSESYASSQAKASFDAVGPIKLHKNAEFGLQTIRDWAPVVAFVLVFGVWATLLVVLVRTFRAMRTGRSRSPASAPQPAAFTSLPTDER